MLLKCGEMLGAVARLATSQSNEAMARIAPRRDGTISLDPSCLVKIPEKSLFGLDSKLFSEVQVDSKRGLDSAVPDKGWLTTTTTTRTQSFAFSPAAVSAGSPLWCSVF
jgi:hypothetical protein